MHRPRFIISETQLRSDSAFLSKKQTHHLRAVLRRTQGSLVELLIRETEQLWCAELRSSADKTEAELQLQQELTVHRPSPLSLIVGLPKPQAAEFIVQRCVEAGATSILFYQAARSQGWTNSAKRKERLAAIRDSAVEQSRCATVCQLDYFEDLQNALQNAESRKKGDFRIKLLLAGPDEAAELHTQPPVITDILKTPDVAETYTAPPLKNSLENNRGNVEIYLLTGPEGGLSSAELEVAGSFSYRMTSLGPNVFRTETATLVACGICRVFA